LFYQELKALCWSRKLTSGAGGVTFDEGEGGGRALKLKSFLAPDTFALNAYKPQKGAMDTSVALSHITGGAFPLSYVFTFAHYAPHSRSLAGDALIVNLCLAGPASAGTRLGDDHYGKDYKRDGH
jgi:hypothetical protein